MSKKGAVYNKYRLKDYAIWVFGTGFHNGHYSAFDMKMLALYLRDECGMKPARLREYLIDFMQAESGRQNKSELAFRAQEALAFAAKKQNVLIQVDRVPVYESEVRWLKELDVPDEVKKVLLAIMVQKRLDAECYMQRHEGKEYYLGYLPADITKMLEIKKMACVPTKQDIYLDVLGRLSQMGLVTIGHASYKLDFWEQLNWGQGSEVAFEIEHFDATGLYWDELMGDKKVKRCEHCGKPFKKRSNRQVLCKECSESGAKYEEPQARQHRCQDCGELFWASVSTTCVQRCPPCQKKHRACREH